MLPKVFVGSSKENLKIVDTIQRLLDHVAEVRPWPTTFKVSSYTLESLVNATEEYDFGIFVFSPDDIVEIRGKKHLAVRDNVIFELGLFVGKLGKERNFIVLPRTSPESRHEDIHLPSDLLGVTPANYDAENKSSLDAALGPACTDIKQEIERLGSRIRPDEAPQIVNTPTASPTAAIARAVGIKQIYPNRNQIDYVKFILKAKAHGEIKMLGITMRDLQAHAIRTAIERKLRSGCKIKLLLLDRNSKFVKKRANDEIQGTGRWKTWRDWRRELIEFDDLHQRYINQLPPELQRNIKLAHFDASPVFSIFMNGKTMVVGFYVSGKLGGSSPHLQLEIKKGSIYSAFEDYFDSLWPFNKR
jgi:hypothetical protein